MYQVAARHLTHLGLSSNLAKKANPVWPERGFGRSVLCDQVAAKGVRVMSLPDDGPTPTVCGPHRSFPDSLKELMGVKDAAATNGGPS